MSSKVANASLATQIAREVLDIPTLDTRNSDSLDFHEVGVGLLRMALVKAFTKGSKGAKPDVAALESLFTLAKKHLGVETLSTRGSDRLDFYGVSVWGLKKALVESFELGRKNLMSSKAAFVKELDSLVKMAKRTASLARRAEEGEKEEESTDKGKKKGPPPKWEEFMKAKYEGGEETSPES